MKHIDLFSGIGGFALAVDRVWPGTEHVFCDNDKFCQAVLKKHWPDAKIYEDIRQFTADPANAGIKKVRKQEDEVFLLTGGFPCQPFSQAGQRRGTSDDRYLWPEMLRVIREFAPEWVIAENVRGLVTWNEGMVLEQVCADLEGEGYEVQPLIIPAVAVNAPHRRDRIWFIAHRTGERNGRVASEKCGIQKRKLESSESQGCEIRSKGQRRTGEQDAPDTNQGGLRRHERQSAEEGSASRDSWERNWVEVATELCSVDDELPYELGGLKLSKPAHRREQLKGYGNAIVPAVAEVIMRAIKES